MDNQDKKDDIEAGEPRLLAEILEDKSPEELVDEFRELGPRDDIKIDDLEDEYYAAQAELDRLSEQVHYKGSPADPETLRKQREAAEDLSEIAIERFQQGK